MKFTFSVPIVPHGGLPCESGIQNERNLRPQIGHDHPGHQKPNDA